jgi:hypothetical protein
LHGALIDGAKTLRQATNKQANNKQIKQTLNKQNKQTNKQTNKKCVTNKQTHT